MKKTDNETLVKELQRIVDSGQPDDTSITPFIAEAALRIEEQEDTINMFKDMNIDKIKRARILIEGLFLAVNIDWLPQEQYIYYKHSNPGECAKYLDRIHTIALAMNEVG